MSSYAKGNALELEVKKTLQAEGWEVFRQHRKPIYMKGKMIMVGCDIFGCDIVAKRKGFRPLWVQVSTPDNKSAKIKQVMAFPWDFEKECLQVWTRIPGKRAYRVYEAPEFEEKGTRSVTG